MAPKISDIIIIKIKEVFAYGVIGNYKNYRIYVDLIELNWELPIPEESIPKVDDEITVIVINTSSRHDSDYLGSVRYLYPEKNPWYDPTIYKIGDEFIGQIDAVNSYGCWAIHPKGAAVRIMVDGLKYGLRIGQEISLRITKINEKHKSIDVEIIS